MDETYDELDKLHTQLLGSQKTHLCVKDRQAAPQSNAEGSAVTQSKQNAATAASASVASVTSVQEELSLRLDSVQEELGAMTIRALQRRAEELGVDDGKLDDAEEKSHIIDLICAAIEANAHVNDGDRQLAWETQPPPPAPGTATQDAAAARQSRLARLRPADAEPEPNIHDERGTAEPRPVQRRAASPRAAQRRRPPGVLCCVARPERVSRVLRNEAQVAQRFLICNVGDALCGKKEVLVQLARFSRTRRPELPADDISENIPSTFEDHEEHVTLGGRRVCICLRDTSGQEAYSQINDCSYKDGACFLLCFSMQQGREATLSNLATMWLPALRAGGHLDNGTSTILVGTSSGSQPLQDDVMSNAEAVAQAIGARLFAPVFLEAEDSVATLYNAMISVVDAHESMSGLTRRVTSDK